MIMMEKTALESSSNRIAQAWPNQATGEALPNASSPKEFEARSHSLDLILDLGTRRDPTLHRCAWYFRLHRILARDPAENQYP
jgi:hypothetical protein